MARGGYAVRMEKDAMPAMFVDWIRVYVNKDYKGGKAPAIRFY